MINREEITRRKAERKKRRRNKRNQKAARMAARIAGTVFSDNEILTHALQNAIKRIKELEVQNGQRDGEQGGGATGGSDVHVGEPNTSADVSNTDQTTI